MMVFRLRIANGVPFIAGVCATALLMIWLLHMRVDAGVDPPIDCNPRNDACAEGCP